MMSLAITQSCPGLQCAQFNSLHDETQARFAGHSEVDVQ